MTPRGEDHKKLMYGRKRAGISDSVMGQSLAPKPKAVDKNFPMPIDIYF